MGAIQKRSHKSIYKTVTENEAMGLSAITKLPMVLDANMYAPILLQKSKHKNALLLLSALFAVIALSTIAIAIVFTLRGKR